MSGVSCGDPYSNIPAGVISQCIGMRQSSRCRDAWHGGMAEARRGVSMIGIDVRTSGTLLLGMPNLASGRGVANPPSLQSPSVWKFSIFRIQTRRVQDRFDSANAEASGVFGVWILQTQRRLAFLVSGFCKRRGAWRFWCSGFANAEAPGVFDVHILQTRSRLAFLVYMFCKRGGAWHFWCPDFANSEAPGVFGVQICYTLPRTT